MWAVSTLDSASVKHRKQQDLLWCFAWMAPPKEFIKYSWKRLEEDHGINIMTSLENTTVIKNCLMQVSLVLFMQVVLPTTVMFKCVWCYCCVYGGNTL